MSTISHPPTRATGQAGWWSLLHVTEMWASLAIAVMWIAVSVSAVWGPDLVSYSSDTNSTSIPSGIAVAIFATIGTWAIAKYGFGHRKAD
jgi:hypothetical protein